MILKRWTRTFWGSRRRCRAPCRGSRPAPPSPLTERHGRPETPPSAAVGALLPRLVRRPSPRQALPKPEPIACNSGKREIRRQRACLRGARRPKPAARPTSPRSTIKWLRARPPGNSKPKSWPDSRRSVLRKCPPDSPRTARSMRAPSANGPFLDIPSLIRSTLLYREAP